MAATNDSMMTPELELLLSKVDSKFTLVVLAARRARQLQEYYSRMGAINTHIIPPQVASLRKPLSMAFEEIAADKIVWVPGAVMEERIRIEEIKKADEEEKVAREKQEVEEIELLKKDDEEIELVANLARGEYKEPPNS